MAQFLGWKSGRGGSRLANVYGCISPGRAHANRDDERGTAMAKKKGAGGRRKGEGGGRKTVVSVPAAREPGLPLWAPVGFDASRVPAEVQQAAREIVQPVYEQFVVRAADGLEKSMGVTIAHLLWLEILEQFDMKKEYCEIDAVLGLPGNRHDAIDRHLRLIDAKVRVGYFLVRIRDLRERAVAARPSDLLASGPADWPPRPSLDVEDGWATAEGGRGRAEGGEIVDAQVLTPEP